jgi:amino acid transporter
MTTYRYDEFDEKIIEQSGFQFKMAYSVRKLSKLNAIISLSRMIFITCIMAVSILFFQQTSTNLVLNPIERMLEKVKLIARNPLAAAQEDQI